jgi:Tol biopolymer transport system component
MVAVVTACQKDKPLPCNSESSENINCEDFPDLWYSWFEEYRFQYKSPCFNPLNSNEFVYYYKDNESGVFQLIKFNLLTNQKTILVNDVKIHGPPKWSKKGWIAFTSQPSLYVEHIFVVKDNGDSLTQITSSISNLNPFWCENGEKLFWTHSPDLGSQWYLIRHNLLYHSTDTISEDWGANVSDLHTNLLLHKKNLNTNPVYGYFNIDSSPLLHSDFNPICNFVGGTSGISWHPSGVYFFVTHSNGEGRGLYKIDINGQISPLIKHCDSKRYSIISCSKDGKKLIAERVESFLERDSDNNPTGKVIQKSSIWLIDTETLMETRINLE